MCVCAHICVGVHKPEGYVSLAISQQAPPGLLSLTSMNLGLQTCLGCLACYVGVRIETPVLMTFVKFLYHDVFSAGHETNVFSSEN